MEEGFTPVMTPDVARPDIIEGIGFNPRGEESQIYSIAGHDLCLIGTAEITIGGMHADTIARELGLYLVRGIRAQTHQQRAPSPEPKGQQWSRRS